MFVSGLFKTNSTVTVDFYNKERIFSNGTVTESYPVTPTLIVTGIMWTGSAADAIVSEQYKPVVQGVIIIDPADYTTTINEDAKVTIDSQDYSVIYVENVAGQDKVIQIPVKRFVAI